MDGIICDAVSRLQSELVTAPSLTLMSANTHTHTHPLLSLLFRFVKHPQIDVSLDFGSERNNDAISFQTFKLYSNIYSFKSRLFPLSFVPKQHTFLYVNN